MADDDARQPGGWGLPRPGTGTAPGASWEGEGQQARPDPPARGRAWRALAVIGVALLLAAGALLLADRAGDPVPGPEPERLPQDTAQVGPGLCLAILPLDRGDDLEPVDCAEQHLAEVVGVLELDQGDYPGESAVLLQAERGCAESFEDYVGAQPAVSGLTLLPVAPRENDWRIDGDRTVVCLAEGPALVGSVRGGQQ